MKMKNSPKNVKAKPAKPPKKNGPSAKRGY